MTDWRFGRLVVTGRAKRAGVYWTCLCDCGTSIDVDGRSLRCGKTASCGCLQRERARAANTTHGKSGTPTHNIWMAMRDRCGNKKSVRYSDYGGRGIRVCKRWQMFAHFLSDMGERPVGMSVDRIDNNGDYTPSNCRWADRYQQANNARSNKHIIWCGEALTEAQWSRRLGLKRTTLQHRLRAGWPVAQALGFTKRPKAERYRCKSKT